MTEPNPQYSERRNLLEENRWLLRERDQLKGELEQWKEAHRKANLECMGHLNKLAAVEKKNEQFLSDLALDQKYLQAQAKELERARELLEQAIASMIQTFSTYGGGWNKPQMLDDIEAFLKSPTAQKIKFQPTNPDLTTPSSEDWIEAVRSKLLYMATYPHSSLCRKTKESGLMFPCLIEFAEEALALLPPASPSQREGI